MIKVPKARAQFFVPGQFSPGGGGHMPPRVNRVNAIVIFVIGRACIFILWYDRIHGTWDSQRREQGTWNGNAFLNSRFSWYEILRHSWWPTLGDAEWKFVSLSLSLSFSPSCCHFYFTFASTSRLWTGGVLGCCFTSWLLERLLSL